MVACRSSCLTVAVASFLLLVFAVNMEGGPISVDTTVDANNTTVDATNTTVDATNTNTTSVDGINTTATSTEQHIDDDDDLLVTRLRIKMCPGRLSSTRSTPLTPTLNVEENKRFDEMSDEDKLRYIYEMQSHVLPENKKLCNEGGKKIKDRYAPKRSLSAFFWFSVDERGKVRAAYPELYEGDVAIELGKRWTAADITVKQKYEDIAEKDKARYEIEMMEYNNKDKSGVNKS